MENITARLAGEELQPAKRYSQQSARNEWLEVFSEKVKESFLGKEKKKKKQKQKQNKTKKGEMEKF